MKFHEEGTEEGSQNHSYRSEYYAYYHTHDSTAFSILASSCHLGEVHRHHIIDNRNKNSYDTPYDQGLHRHFFRSPDIKKQKSHPAYRCSRKSRKDAACNTQHSGQYRQYYHRCFHIIISFTGTPYYLYMVPRIIRLTLYLRYHTKGLEDGEGRDGGRRLLSRECRPQDGCLRSHSNPPASHSLQIPCQCPLSSTAR